MIFQLTAEQQIRLEVFRRLTLDGHAHASLVSNIEILSAAIIGTPEPKPVESPVKLAADGVTRIVSYQGLSITAPSWANYVAADYDGEVYFYAVQDSVNCRVYPINGDNESLGVLLPVLEGDDTYPVLKL